MNEARAIFNKLGTTFDALEAIEKLAKQVMLGSSKIDEALEVLRIITAIVEALKAGFKGKLTVDEVKAEIEALRKALSNNDAWADQALDDKFRA